MAGVIVVGLTLPVMWFGIWVPVMVAVARAHGLSRAVAVPMSILGPVGAVIAVAVGRVRRSGS